MKASIKGYNVITTTSILYTLRDIFITVLDVWVGNLTPYQRGGVENIDLNSYASQKVMPQSDCGTGNKRCQTS